MTDLPPKIPDIPREKIKPPVIEEKVDINDFYSPEVQEILLKVEGWVNHIVSWNETKKDIKELNNEYEWKFIEKLKKLPDYKESKVQKAIEQKTLKVKKVPWRNLYSLYEKEWWNLIYFINLDWSKYSNISYIREYWNWYWTIQEWYKLKYNAIEKIENWIYYLYIWNRKINPNSDEYLKIILSWLDPYLKIMYELQNEFKNEDNIKINQLIY